MAWKSKARVGALAASLALAGCVTSSTAPPQRQVQGVRAAPQVEAQASAFARFMRTAGEVDAAFSGPAAVAAGLQAGAAYEPKQLEAGMIAFTAVAALQDPGFVAGVRRMAKAEGAGPLARRLGANPAKALELPGAGPAASRARAALVRQGAGLAQRGGAVKAAAYSIQRQPWAKKQVADAPARLARAKTLGKAVYRADGQDGARLYQAVAQPGLRSGAAGPVMARGLALAALSVIGEERGAPALMQEPRSGSCLRIAKLNFHQCLASAGPYYEDIYCLGVHAMIDPGQCVAQAAGAPAAAKVAQR